MNAAENFMFHLIKGIGAEMISRLIDLLINRKIIRNNFVIFQAQMEKKSQVPVPGLIREKTEYCWV